MANIFYTNRPFRVGEVFDTRDFCEENLETARTFHPDVLDVEEFLEEVREDVASREEPATPGHFPTKRDLPQRFCSILAIPWPETHEIDISRYDPGAQGKPQRLVEMPDAPGIGVYCYYILPKQNTKRAMVDERWVQEMVDRWPEIQRSGVAEEMAEQYWEGKPKTFRGMYMTYLLEGPIFVKSVCRTPVRAVAR